MLEQALSRARAGGAESSPFVSGLSAAPPAAPPAENCFSRARTQQFFLLCAHVHTARLSVCVFCRHAHNTPPPHTLCSETRLRPSPLCSMPPPTYVERSAHLGPPASRRRPATQHSPAMPHPPFLWPWHSFLCALLLKTPPLGRPLPRWPSSTRDDIRTHTPAHIHTCTRNPTTIAHSCTQFLL